MVVMSDPRTWPLCDVLPLKRPGDELWPELGVLIPERGATVFLVDAFAPGMWRKLATCQRIEFKDFEELEAAGWIID